MHGNLVRTKIPQTSHFHLKGKICTQEVDVGHIFQVHITIKPTGSVHFLRFNKEVAVFPPRLCIEKASAQGTCKLALGCLGEKRLLAPAPTGLYPKSPALLSNGHLVSLADSYEFTPHWKYRYTFIYNIYMCVQYMFTYTQRHTHLHTHWPWFRRTIPLKKPTKYHITGLSIISVKTTFPHLFPELLRTFPSIQTSANLAEITSLSFPECLFFSHQE